MVGVAPLLCDQVGGGGAWGGGGRGVARRVVERGKARQILGVALCADTIAAVYCIVLVQHLAAGRIDPVEFPAGEGAALHSKEVAAAVGVDHEVDQPIGTWADIPFRDPL